MSPERRSLRVFRDDTDIRTGALSEELNGALDTSRSLVVCCSPSVLKSEWVAKEIDRFLDHDGNRPVIPVLLQGDAGSSIPERLTPFNHRFADLRSAWLLGRLKPKARDELIRALATISGVELRQLISWDKRRQRRVFFSSAAGVSVVAVAVSLWPVETRRKLDQPKQIAADDAIEYCDVSGERLILAARQKIKKQNQENVADVEYTMLYEDALNSKSKGKYLDQSDYTVPNRLVHAGRLRSARKILEETDRAMVARQARKLAQDKYPYSQEEKDAFRGVWAAEPRPGLRIVLYAVKASSLEAGDGPAAGNAVVVIAEKDRPLRFTTVDGLYPPEVEDSSISTRGAVLMNGLSILASGSDILIGMAIRKNGGLGGLWRWNGSATSWERQKKVPRSVYSMIADPRQPGRVLLSTAPGSWESDARRGEMPTLFFERPNQQSDWREFQLLAVDSKAEVQLCGFAKDGSLYVRNHQALFAIGSRPLYRNWF